MPGLIAKTKTLPFRRALKDVSTTLIDGSADVITKSSNTNVPFTDKLRPHRSKQGGSTNESRFPDRLMDGPGPMTGWAVDCTHSTPAHGPSTKVNGSVGLTIARQRETRMDPGRPARW